jgi:threonine/homoserine/homoserine lactone efflux protein
VPPPVTEVLWPWLTLAGLGVHHGVNPGMGWLFAVARGLQERRRRAVLAALLPIAGGHELSVVVVVVVVALTQALVPPHTVRLLAALALVCFGLYTLLKPSPMTRAARYRPPPSSRTERPGHR